MAFTATWQPLICPDVLWCCDIRLMRDCEADGGEPSSPPHDESEHLVKCYKQAAGEQRSSSTAQVAVELDLPPAETLQSLLDPFPPAPLRGGLAAAASVGLLRQGGGAVRVETGPGAGTGAQLKGRFMLSRAISILKARACMKFAAPTGTC